MPFLEAGKWDFVHWDWDSRAKNNRKMGMGFQFEQHRLGLWDLSWDLKKTISWEMGLGPSLHDPLSDNLNANKGNSQKTWKVINELTSCNSGKSASILEIKADHKIVSNPMAIAETIDKHFSNVAQVLAHDILLVDVNPEFYLERTNCSFSLQTPSVSIVFELFEEN